MNRSSRVAQLMSAFTQTICLILACSCGGAGEEFSLGMAQGDYDLRQIAGEYIDIPVPCVLKVSGLKATANCKQGDEWELAIDISFGEKEVKGTAKYVYVTGEEGFDDLLIHRTYNISAKKQLEKMVQGKFSALAGDWEVKVVEKEERKKKTAGEVITYEVVRNGTAWVLGSTATLLLRWGSDSYACAEVKDEDGRTTLRQTGSLGGNPTTLEDCDWALSYYY